MHAFGLQSLEQACCVVGADGHLDFLRLIGQLEEVRRVNAAMMAKALAAGESLNSYCVKALCKV
jgi:hypothetical protein